MKQETIVKKLLAIIVCGTDEQINLANWIKILATLLNNLRPKNSIIPLLKKRRTTYCFDKVMIDQLKKENKRKM